MNDVKQRNAVPAVAPQVEVMMWLKWMAVLLALMGASVSRADGFDGKEAPVGYSGEVAFEWVEDPFIPKMRLTEELLYRQSDGRI